MEFNFHSITEQLRHLVPIMMLDQISAVRFWRRGDGVCVEVELKNLYTLSIAPKVRNKEGEKGVSVYGDIADAAGLFEVAVFDSDHHYDREALGFGERDVFGYISAVEVRELLLKLAKLPPKLKMVG